MDRSRTDPAGPRCGRRGILATVAGGLAALAGCTTGDGGTTDDGLDLREANVTNVAFERRDGAYRFSVELYHDDDGEDGYANWWQVETPDGERLGRRKLLHAHGTRKFTRSETVEVPDGVDRVVVRGHDRTHGYGGQAAVVTPSSGDVAFVRQGSEREDLSDRARRQERRTTAAIHPVDIHDPAQIDGRSPSSMHEPGG